MLMRTSPEPGCVLVLLGIQRRMMRAVIAVRLAVQRRHERRRLLALSDKMLKDIGISRGEVERIVSMAIPEGRGRR